MASGLSDRPDHPAGDAGSTLTASAPEGVYLHIPFCVSVCPYCDFVVVAGSAARGPSDRKAELVAAMHAEIDLRADEIDEAFGPQGGDPSALTSIYLGGGTPSLLGAAVVAGLLDHVSGRFGSVAEAEITLEANPGPDEIGDLRGFRDAGVTRLSIGAQSTDAEQLRELGRRHRPQDVVAAVTSAREAGFDDVSVDLLTDVPGQDESAWAGTLASVLDLEPDHLSIYSLALGDPDAEGLTGPNGDHLPVSRGARRWRERARPRQSQDRARRMDGITDELTARAGFERYEIANLARPEHRSRHNLLYWRRRPFVGLGPGAHSSDGALRRSWNAAPLDGYVAALDTTSEAVVPPGGSDFIDEETALAETAMLALRLNDGLEAGAVATPSVVAGLAWAREHDLVRSTGGRHVLTEEGRALADEVFVRLFPPAERGAAT